MTQPGTWRTKGAEVVFLPPTDTKPGRMRARHLLTRRRAVVSQRGAEEPYDAAERAARVVLGGGQLFPGLLQLLSVSVDGGGWIFVVVPEALLRRRQRAESTTLTKREAEREFRSRVLPRVRSQYERDGVPDWPARREAWNDWTDELCKSGRITAHQYATWTHPACCGRGQS